MNKMTGIILMVVGSILLLAGIIVFSKSTSTNKLPDNNVAIKASNEVVIKNEKTIDPIVPEAKSNKPNEVIGDVSTKSKADINDDAKKKGNDFEKYIVQKFSKKYFKIKEWAGDKYVNGRFAETTLHPDLVYEFSLGKESKTFAVECKWRKELYKKCIEFATEDQLKRYKKFEKEKGVPVHIAIGIGGEASHPEQLFIIPLKEIETVLLNIDFLKKYEKDMHKNFYFDIKTERLD